MRLHRHPFLLRHYELLPQRALGAAVARLAKIRTPQPAVQAAIRFWVRRGGISLSEYIGQPWTTLHDFFLRELRPGARPLGRGLVSPVDGVVVACETIRDDHVLSVKGRPIRLRRLLCGRTHHLDLGDFTGGSQLTLFLTPHGYHHVHAPMEAMLDSVRWIAGRFFPQNDDALRHIPRVYERNERATLAFVLPDGRQWYMSMVAASLVGSIVLDGVQGQSWRQTESCLLHRSVNKGDRLGHFALGSTVVLVFPKSTVLWHELRTGQRIQMGQTLGELL